MRQTVTSIRHDFYIDGEKAYLQMRTDLEIWYGVHPIDYSFPPGDDRRYGQPEPDMIGSISDGYKLKGQPDATR